MVKKYDERAFMDTEGLSAMRGSIYFDDTADQDGMVSLDADLLFIDGYGGNVNVDFSTYGSMERLEEVREKLATFEAFVTAFCTALREELDKYDPL